MLIDCDACAARGPACGDCVITVLMGAPPAARPGGLDLDGAERAAIAVLAGSGLVPPLRLVIDSRPAPSTVPARSPGSGRAVTQRRRPVRSTRRQAG